MAATAGYAPKEIALTLSSGGDDYVEPTVEDASDDDLAALADTQATTSAAAVPEAPVPAIPSGSAVPPDSDYATREAALIAAMAKTGHPIVKVSGARSRAAQAALYAKGRSTPGPVVTEKSGAPGDESRHQLGQASDFAFVGPDGKPSYDPSHPWDTLGRMAKAHGFEWGGDWQTLKDQGHVQLPGAPAPGTGAPSPAIEDATPADLQAIEAATPADLAAIGQKPPAPPLPFWRRALDPIAESLPMIGGATGGMLAGTAAAGSAPFTGGASAAAVPTAALLGAGAGGWAGEQLRQLYRSAIGVEPHPGWAESVSKTLQAGNTQMIQEGVGQGIGGLLALRAAGKPGAAAAAAATDKYGLKLSGPEQSGSLIGRNLQRGLAYLSGGAKYYTEQVRKAGDLNAIKAVKEALNAISSEVTQTEAGEAARRGLFAAREGLRTGPIGQLYDHVKATGPNVDLRPQIRTLMDLFRKEGVPVAVRRKLLKLLPKPLGPVPVPFSYNATSPYMVTFEQAAKLRTRLGTVGRKALEPLGVDATSIATKWYGDLTQALNAAHPDFGTASTLWKYGRRLLTGKFMKTILTASPDTVVRAMGPTPTTRMVTALRDNFLWLAGQGSASDAAAGIEAWQSLRRSWFERYILRDGSGAFDPAGMVARLSKMNGILHEMYGYPGDRAGQEIVERATAIGKALERRVPLPGTLHAGLARGGEIYATIQAAIQNGAVSAGEVLAFTEAVPSLVTYLMHQPTMAKLFTRAMTSPSGQASGKVLARILSSFILDGGQPPPEGTDDHDLMLQDDPDRPLVPPPPQG